MSELNESSIFDLAIDNEGSANLAEAAKWSKVVAIFGLIVGVFVVLAGAFLAVAGRTISAFSTIGALGPFLGFIYIVIGAVMVYPNWKLLKFGSSMSPGLRKNDQVMVNDALKSLKYYFKFLGIFMLVIIGIYLLAIVVVIMSGSFMK